MRKLMLTASLAALGIGFFALLILAFPGYTSAQPVSECWCCIDGHVSYGPMINCRSKGGICYRTEGNAMRRCHPAGCWCCINGYVSYGSMINCRSKGGICYRTEGNAMRRCR
jgi:hypothetical protein